MRDIGLTNLGDTAALLGVNRATVRDVVRLHKIPTHPMSNGNARGLDRKSVRLVAKILGVDLRCLSAA